MLILMLAVVLFLATHSVPAIPAVRQRAIAVLGWKGYVLLYSLLSIASLVLVGWGYRQAPYLPLWERDPRLFWLPVLVMPWAWMLVVAGLVIPNPFSISLWRDRAAEPPVGVPAVVRHPVLWGFLLWAVAHMVVNEDAASLLMFGLFALLALMGMRGLDRKRRRLWGDEQWSRCWERRSWRAAHWSQAVALLAGLAAYGVFLELHERLIGVAPWPAGF